MARACIVDVRIMKKLRGRNALVTGGSRGIGSHVARALADEGVNVALAARSLADLERVRDEIRGLGVSAAAIRTDLADPAAPETLVREAEAKLGPVDILVNNAGLQSTAPYHEHPAEAIVASVRVNLLAAMLLTRAVLPGMLERRRGHVVSMSSMAGKIGLPFSASYGATKAALIMLTHSLRAELAGSPVGVSAVCPGFVAGDGMFARAEEVAGPPSLLSRPTTVEKVAAAVVRAIRKDVPEIIVNPLPVRPAVMLREAIPGVTPLLHELLGTASFARGVMEAEEGDGGPG